MRDLLFFVAFLPMPFLSFLYPWAGLMIWGWLAFLNPHRDLWGFAAGFSYNYWIAIFTIAGFVIMSGEKRIRIDLNFILIFVLGLFLVISTTFSLSPSFSQPKAEEFIKIITFVLLLHVMLDRMIRIYAFVWLMVLCIGFFGVKGGSLFIASAGNHFFAGPWGSYIADRNHLAVAMLMVIPLLNFLRLHSAQRWLQIGMAVALVFTVLAVIGTSSRGGFVGLVGMGAFLWLRSRNKIMTALFVGPIVVGLVFVVPEKWVERIQTIETAADEDTSFQGRLNSWQTHFNAGMDRPLIGAGPYALNDSEVFARYEPYERIIDYDNKQRGRAAHSIYFQVIGELGFAAFAVYMLLAAITWLNAQRVIRLTKNNVDFLWAQDLARMLQVSMVGFFAAGAAVSMAFYDFYLALTVTAAALRSLVDRRIPMKLSRQSPTISLTDFKTGNELNQRN